MPLERICHVKSWRLAFCCLEELVYCQWSHAAEVFLLKIIVPQYMIVHKACEWLRFSRLQTLHQNSVCYTTPAELIFRAYKLDGLAAETLNICLGERKGRDCGMLAKPVKFTLSRVWRGQNLWNSSRTERQREGASLVRRAWTVTEATRTNGLKWVACSDIWANTIAVLYAWLSRPGSISASEFINRLVCGVWKPLCHSELLRRQTLKKTKNCILLSCRCLWCPSIQV